MAIIGMSDVAPLGADSAGHSDAGDTEPQALCPEEMGGHRGPDGRATSSTAPASR